MRPFAYIALCVFSLTTPVGVARGDGGSTGASGSSGPTPAVVDQRVQESELTTVRLTPQAEKRLGIQLATVELQSVRRTRTLPGVAMIPPGRAVVVSSPTAGVVSLPNEKSTAPQAGAKVAAFEPVLTLIPGATEEGLALAESDRISMARALADVLAARTNAEGQVREDSIRVDAAKIKLDRAVALKEESVGSQRQLDEARAEYSLAQAAQAASTERLAVLEEVLARLKSGKAAAIPLATSLSGLIQSVHVAPGQAVPAGAPLFEVVCLDPIWVRVPVYVGDMNRLQLEETAQVRSLADLPGTESLVARRIFLPGSGDAAAATIDFYYELANADGTIRPGQRLGVALPLKDETSGAVVPRSAILHDIHGGTWVYVNTAPQTFVRRRILVSDVAGDLALLAQGPEVGAKVVTDGAAELFGTEFGAGK